LAYPFVAHNSRRELKTLHHRTQVSNSDRASIPMRVPSRITKCLPYRPLPFSGNATAAMRRVLPAMAAGDKLPSRGLKILTTVADRRKCPGISDVGVAIAASPCECNLQGVAWRGRRRFDIEPPRGCSGRTAQRDRRTARRRGAETAAVKIVEERGSSSRCAHRVRH